MLEGAVRGLGRCMRWGGGENAKEQKKTDHIALAHVVPRR